MLNLHDDKAAHYKLSREQACLYPLRVESLQHHL